jgi:hypothetical protein
VRDFGGSVPAASTGQLLRRGGLPGGAVTPGSFSLSVIDARLKLRDDLVQRGAQGVIHCFGKDVRPRRDEMRADAKGGAGVVPVFDEDAGFVDAQCLAQRFKALADEGGEGGRGLVVKVIEDEFHDAPTFATHCGFDKYTFPHL